MIADGAGGGPGVGEGGAGLGTAEAEDEAVHLFEEAGDFRKLGTEGDGEGVATGNGGGGIGDDFLEIGGFLGEQGGIGGGEVVSGECGGGLGEGGGEFLVEELGLGDEFGIPQALPSTEREVHLGGIALVAVFLIPVGEGLAEFVGEGFEFLFLAFFGLGVAGGGGLLAGDQVGEACDEGPEFGGAGGEWQGFLVVPSGLILRGIEEREDGEVHVLAVGVFVLHGGFGRESRE